MVRISVRAPYPTILTPIVAANMNNWCPQILVQKFSGFFIPLLTPIVAEPGRRSLLSRSGASPSLGCLKLAVRDPRNYNAPLRGGIGQGDWPRGVSNTFTNPSARQGYNPGLNSGGLIAERSVSLLKPLLINPIISTSQKSFYGKE